MISPLRVADTASVLSLELGNALEKYGHWPSPTAIVSDGPYGLSKFPGDLNGEESLGEWYALHIATWSKQALPETTLWFWCSEVEWAKVHSVLKLHGWRYVVSEICVQYQRG